MKYRTEVVREGEWFEDGGPDVWLKTHADNAGTDGNSPPPLTFKQEAMIRRLATEPPAGRFWLVQESGYWHRLCVVGLYDGWVYWKARVCLGTDGPISGLHTHEGYHLTAIGLGERDDGKRFPYNGWRLISEVST